MPGMMPTNHFAGRTGSRGNLIICPKLEAHIGTILSSEWKAEETRVKVQAARVSKKEVGDTAASGRRAKIRS